VRQRTLPESFEGSYRDFLPDNGKVYFTHGDLTLGNIMVAGDPGSKDIVGIIDWEQAGWYPEYWEYCKLLYGVEYSHEWRAEGWAEQVMAAFPEEWIAFAEYSLWRCP
jgi:thiamine kinase-like enzyme